MNNLPSNVLAEINDFRFGALSDWKKSFKYVLIEMDSWFFYFKDIYEHVHYMDVNDDDKLINYIYVSTLMNSVYKSHFYDIPFAVDDSSVISDYDDYDDAGFEWNDISGMI